MNPSPELTTTLKQLRMSGVLDSLAQRDRQAIDGKLAYTEFLAMLLHDEVARRDQKKLGSRILRAGFGLGKTLESFDFDLLPKLNRAQINDLATGRYIDEKVAVLMVGQIGVGNCISHRRCAIAPRVTGTYERKFQQFARVPLLIFDDFALRPLRAPHDEDFHDLIAARYESAATNLTSKLDLDE